MPQGPASMAQAELISRVEAVLRQRVAAGQELLLGLSGGVDSVVLLDLLARLRGSLGFRLSALHVNHRINPAAGQWAAFCERLCRARDVPLEQVAVEVRRRPGESLEAAAREARYRAFRGRRADFVVLAHHLDDQAETLLLQLLRGAGLKGMSAMPEAGAPAPGAPPEAPRPALLRPLLEVPRATLEAYARENGLSWVEDVSNLDLAFDRNYLRHRVFPILEKRFPAYRKTFHRASRHLAEAAQLLDQLARMDAAHAVAGGRLDVDALRALGAARAKNLLRCYLEGRGLLMPSARRLDEVLRQLEDARPDARVRIALGEYEMCRFKGQAYLQRKAAPPADGLCRPWQGEEALELPGLGGILRFEAVTGAGISLESLAGGPVTVRSRRGGERMRPDCKRPERTLKNLFQEAELPPWRRQALPLLFCAERLVCAPGIGVDCAYQAAPGEPGLVVVWRELEGP